MEKEVTLRDALPEVALIGTLLLIWGISDAIRLPLNIHAELQRSFHPTMIWITQNIVDYLLHIGAIIIGIGLLRCASWARRGAIMLLTAFAVYWLSALLITMSYHSWETFRINGLSNLLAFTQRDFTQALRDLVMVLFLAASRVHRAWEETPQPGPLADLSARIMRVLPRMTAPVIAMIGIILSLCWGLLPLVRYLVGTCQELADSRSHMQVASSIQQVILMYFPISLFALAYLIAGIGLLRQAIWARWLGIATLAVEGMYVVYLILHSLLSSPSNIFSNFTNLFMFLCYHLTSILVYAVFIDFLWRSWPKKIPEDVDRLLCDEVG